MSSIELLELAGVPVVLRSPTSTDQPAPLIVLWHGFGIPNSEEVLAETFPLESVQAWKAYVGLPLFGKRLPAGGIEELMRRQISDYVLELLLPVVEQAMQELPVVVQSLQERFYINSDTGIGLFGFSAGALAALLTLAESQLSVNTAVLAGVGKDLEAYVGGYEWACNEYFPTLKEQFPWIEEKHKKYHWSKESEAAKQRLDFMVRAQDIAKRNPLPALLFVHGAQDEIFSVDDTQKLYTEMQPHYEQAQASERLSIQVFKHLRHQIDLKAAEASPEISEDIAELQNTVTHWFSKHIVEDSNL
jgi:dienelactone hydrolase